MMVVCPQCHHHSTDRPFCERCNAALPVNDPGAVPDRAVLPDGRLVDCSAWSGHWPADCWRYLASTIDGQPCRVYALNRGWWRDLAAGVAQRENAALDVLAPI